ncbi:MAG: antirestriction protein ArdA [Clostridia bacterium]|nr:antirestriction protein ArdA [Clostridia bacterium]
MIKIRIRNADHEIDVHFPISESELFAKLGEIHAVEGRDAAQSAYVTEVYWPEEFSALKNRFANLDELNYLAKRMESFDNLEYDQFIIGLSKLDSKDVKDLINLTFNLSHFTLCQDVSSYGKIGREYVLNTEGAVPTHDEDDPKYAAIGKELIDKGLAQITERGLLIYNPFDTLEEVYDGHTFPEYYYKNSLISLNAKYGDRTELLQLPDESLAIKKAIDRLGAPSAEDCSYEITFHNFKGDEWLDRVQEIISREGIYEANAMLKALDSKEMDWNKLSAVVELAGVQKASNIVFLTEHLDEFSFIPEAKTEEEVGHYLVDNISEYRLNLEMEDYFDFSGFGEHIAEEHDGQFVDGGFVYYDSYDSLDELLDGLEPEDEGIDMGGM